MKVYVYGKFDESANLQPLISFEDRVEAKAFANSIKGQSILIGNCPYPFKFDKIIVSKKQIEDWEENVIIV